MKCRTGGRSPDRDRRYTFKHLGVHTLRSLNFVVYRLDIRGLLRYIRNRHGVYNTIARAERIFGWGEK